MLAFRKLPHGPWGIITTATGNHPGEAVKVPTKSGKLKDVVLGELLYEAGEFRVWTIEVSNLNSVDREAA